MPGGTTRTTVYFPPYPLYVAEAKGCRLTDVDGVSRLDLIGNYSATVLGHQHPAIRSALHAQIECGTAFAAANPYEVELASELCARVPSLESVRFTSSGTEATMFALRLARVATGRTRMAKFEGGYHGTHDFAEVSVHPGPEHWGSIDAPSSVPESRGTHPAGVANTLVLPFNDIGVTAKLLEENRHTVGAVIVEPVLGVAGMIPPEPDFLGQLRELTLGLGMVLIFDEVITLRLAHGGAQAYYQVIPDLTTMGKIIGGGLPVAAFGGRDGLMGLLDARNSGFTPQGGTFNGYPLGMVAGLAQMRELQPALIEDLNVRPMTTYIVM